MSATKEHYHDKIEEGMRSSKLVANNSKPILFSGAMVLAILEGRKTQTRRSSKLDHINTDADRWEFVRLETDPDVVVRRPGLTDRFNKLKGHYATFEQKKDGISYFAKCPYGKPGDLLWVRETTAFTKGEFQAYDTISYRADNFHKDINRPGVDFPEKEMCKDGWYDKNLSKEVKWTPSIHVKKIYARIWLEVTEIKVERLQNITEKDAIAEGVAKIEHPLFGSLYKNYCFGNQDDDSIGSKSPNESFFSLWESINGIASHEVNPWVWVIKFKVLSTSGKENIQHSINNIQ